MQWKVDRYDLSFDVRIFDQRKATHRINLQKKKETRNNRMLILYAKWSKIWTYKIVFPYSCLVSLKFYKIIFMYIINFLITKVNYSQRSVHRLVIDPDFILLRISW